MIYQNIGEISKKLGDTIEKEFPDFAVYPVGMELVEPDNKCRIVKRLTFKDEFE